MTTSECRSRWLRARALNLRSALEKNAKLVTLDMLGCRAVTTVVITKVLDVLHSFPYGFGVGTESRIDGGLGATNQRVVRGTCCQGGHRTIASPRGGRRASPFGRFRLVGDRGRSSG